MPDLPTVAVAAELATAPPQRRSCAECGQPFKPSRFHQSFCCPAHKVAFQNRAAVEGRAIIALAKAWRASRNRREDSALGSQCLSELCTILDEFNARDREAGRPAAQAYAKRLLAMGRYMDRETRK
jgi:hypothetical protein